MSFFTVGAPPHRSTVNRLTTKYAVHLTVDVTALGVDDNDDLHFEMRVVEASYYDHSAEQLLKHHAKELGSLPDQTARDEAYLRKMSRPLYFVQRCNGEVIQIFHPVAEDPAILNMKKSFLQTISLRLSDDLQEGHVEDHYGECFV